MNKDLTYYIIKYRLKVVPVMSDDDGTKPRLLYWDVFSESKAGYWGDGDTLKKAIKDWAERNKVEL